MWFLPPKVKPDWSAAEAHLRAADPIIAGIVDRVGPCTLVPLGKFPGNAFMILCQSIFTQQISTAVATVLFARFRKLFPRSRPTPELTLTLADDQLRSVGLSRQKMAYIRDLARHFVDGRLTLRQFPRMDDEAIIAALTDVHGIGRWTAEMFLMFVMVRPDVLPVDDLGIQKNLAKAYNKRHPLKKKQMLALTELWRPYRTVGSWYLWRMTEA
jgi:DNA-3-methyladenine glycosylase II